MKNKYKLTVIIPTFNRQKYLEIILKKLVKIRNQFICFYILDNHSKDETSKIIKKYKLIDPRVYSFRHKNNIGAAPNFRFGLYNAKTDFVVFASDDDTFNGDYFSKCLKIFEKYPDVGIIHHKFGNFKDKKIKKKYTIYDQNINSISKCFRYSTILSGLAVNKNLINFDNYPKNKNKIYSYVSMIFQILKKHKFVEINNCGFSPVHAPDVNTTKMIEKNILVQSRPIDFGIKELSNYIFKSKFNDFEKIEIFLKSHFFWICNITEYYPKQKLKSFIKSMDVCFGKYILSYYFFILFKRFNFTIFKLLLIRLLNIKLWKYHLYNVIVLTMMIVKK